MEIVAPNAMINDETQNQNINYGQMGNYDQQQNYNQTNTYDQMNNNYDQTMNYNQNMNYDQSMNYDQNQNNLYQSNQYSHESQNERFDQFFTQNPVPNSQYMHTDPYYNEINGQYYNNDVYNYNDPGNQYDYQYNSNVNSTYNQQYNNNNNQDVSRSPSPVLNLRPSQGVNSGMPNTKSSNSLKSFFNYNVIRGNQNNSNNNNENWI